MYYLCVYVCVVFVVYKYCYINLSSLKSLGELWLQGCKLALSPIILVEYWLSNFQFCAEIKSANYYSSASTSAVPSLYIKESMLV